jgi:hypothetical protein
MLFIKNKAKNIGFTGLILSSSLLTGLLFEINLKALESSTEVKPVGRWVSPSMRRRLEAEAAKLAADGSTVCLDKAVETAAPAPDTASKPTAATRPSYEPLSAVGFAAIAIDTTVTESPRGVSFSEASPLESARSAIDSRHSSLRLSTTPKVRKRVSFAEKPEIREYDPQSLTYREELNIRLAIQAEAAAREQRIADARRIHDACDIADLGRSVRLAYAPKSVRFEAEYQEYLREKSLSATYQSPKLKEKLKVVITAKEI